MASTTENRNAVILLAELHNVRRGTGIGMCFLSGCQSPTRQALPGVNTPASENDIDPYEELEERAEPG